MLHVFDSNYVQYQNFGYVWIRTKALWYWKRPLSQPSSNQCPSKYDLKWSLQYFKLASEIPWRVGGQAREKQQFVEELDFLSFNILKSAVDGCFSFVKAMRESAAVDWPIWKTFNEYIWRVVCYDVNQTHLIIWANQRPGPLPCLPE